MIPSPGRIVEYTLTPQDANDINARREHARTSKIIENATGAQVHAGNPVTAGESYPMVIIRAWGATEDSAINGQVLLDGNDTYWATSRTQGTESGQWHEYARVTAPPAEAPPVEVRDGTGRVLGADAPTEAPPETADDANSASPGDAESASQ